MIAPLVQRDSESITSWGTLADDSVQKSVETVHDVHDKVTESQAVTNILTPVSEPSITDIVVDSLSTPSLESATTPTGSSSLPELESPSTPFSWGDEPLDDTNYMDPPTKDLTDLDATAPSSMYTSWAAVEVPDWGPITMGSAGDANGAGDAISLVSQANRAEHVGSQTSAKAKGNWKETSQENAAAAPQTRNKHKPTNDAGPTITSTGTAPHPTAESAEPKPSPVSRGVPEEQIPDWLLGQGEDSFAVLGLSRPATPEPLSTPDSLPPKQGLNRPRLSQTPGESIPALDLSPRCKRPATSVASGPITQSAGRTGWKIISSEAPTTSAPSKDIGQPAKKKYHSKRKQAGKSSK